MTADTFGLDPSGYSIAITLWVRLLGLLYIVVYVPFLFQIRGLVGKEGILPAADYLKLIRERLGRSRFYYLPTLFWFGASDRALVLHLWTGITLGVLVAFGIYPSLLLLGLFALHLSLVNIGQDFMRFGWETLLLELTMATVLTIATTPYNMVGWIALNFLFVRFMLQAGCSKLRSHDKTWRDLTAISYHYLTQPIPNLTAWFFDKLPMWFHKVCVLITFYAELGVPLLTFSPPDVRLFVFVNMFGLQLTIWFTGNLSYLNHMCALVSVIYIHNKFLSPFIADHPLGGPSGDEWSLIVSLLAAVFLALQIANLWNYFFPQPLLRRFLVLAEPFHIAHQHQLFSMMTTKRYEVIIEGSYDGQNWLPYLYYYKPCEIARRPQRISPYQPRLDWQSWFLPFAPYRQQYWFQAFIAKLLQGSVPVSKLLRYNPFPDRPPIFIRVSLYDYHYTSFEEMHRTGNWWHRTYVGEYAPSMRLKP